MKTIIYCPGCGWPLGENLGCDYCADWLELQADLEADRQREANRPHCPTCGQRMYISPITDEGHDCRCGYTWRPGDRRAR